MTAAYAGGAAHFPGNNERQLLARIAQLETSHRELLVALQAEQEWRERDEAGALDPEWDYELMVGDKRRRAITNSERVAS